MEQLLGSSPAGTQAFFYRAEGGAEIDLLLELPGRGLWAVEVKRSLSPGSRRASTTHLRICRHPQVS